MIFFLVDMPGVAPDLIDRLIQRHRETLAPLVWPEFEGRRGNPILFDRSLFSELRQVRGDTGGKPVLLRYQDRAERVIVSDKSILQDFDRPEGLAATEFKVQGSKVDRPEPNFKFLTTLHAQNFFAVWKFAARI